MIGMESEVNRMLESESKAEVAQEVTDGERDTFIQQVVESPSTDDVANAMLEMDKNSMKDFEYLYKNGLNLSAMVAIKNALRDYAGNVFDRSRNG